MEIITRDYGTVEVDESAIVRFDDGIIGFEDCRDFVLLNISDEPSPFRCLQSIDDSGLAFIVIDPYFVRPDYEVSIDDDAAAILNIDGDEDIVILAIVVVPDDFKLMTINLKAPIIINARVNKGAQYIVDGTDYNVRHNLTDEIERAKTININEDQTTARQVV